MAMGKKHNWTQKEIDTLCEMRGSGSTFKQIENALGTVHQSTIRKKYEDIKAGNTASKKGEPWTDSEDEIIINGYANNKTARMIAKELGEKRTIDSIYARITALKNIQKIGERKKFRKTEAKDKRVFRSKQSKIPASNNNDENHIKKTESMKEAYERLGWKKTMDPYMMLSVRSTIEQKTKQLIGGAIDRGNHIHAMTLLSVAADRSQRDIVDIAKLTLMPLKFVEQIFVRLDAEGIWPANQKTNDNMTAETYAQMAEICKEEMA